MDRGRYHRSGPQGRGRLFTRVPRKLEPGIEIPGSPLLARSRRYFLSPEGGGVYAADQT
jgi:hypothetical protein